MPLWSRTGDLVLPLVDLNFPVIVSDLEFYADLEDMPVPIRAGIDPYVDGFFESGVQTKEPAEPQAPADGEEAQEADIWNVTVCGLSAESLETLTAYLDRKLLEQFSQRCRVPFTLNLVEGDVEGLLVRIGEIDHTDIQLGVAIWKSEGYL